MRLTFAVGILAALSLACAQEATRERGLRAFGNEPFWNVTISVDDGIAFGLMGEPDIRFAYQSPAPFGDPTTLGYGPLKDDSGRHEIHIQVSEEDCQDTMADVVHPMRSYVNLDGIEFVGCARLLAEELPGERP